MTLEDVNKIMLRYVQNWNKSNPMAPLYLMATKKRGFHFGYGGHLIFVRTDDIAPENVLAAFFHAYGQAEYERDHSGPINEFEAEAFAIRRSLELFVAEDFEDLAYRVAANIKALAANEPYRSAVERLANDDLWRKYARLDNDAAFRAAKA
jgi:hypothetical protein